jgi:hypothetical protein
MIIKGSIIVTKKKVLDVLNGVANDGTHSNMIIALIVMVS